MSERLIGILPLLVGMVIIFMSFGARDKHREIRKDPVHTKARIECLVKHHKVRGAAKEDFYTYAINYDGHSGTVSSSRPLSGNVDVVYSASNPSLLVRRGELSSGRNLFGIIIGSLASLMGIGLLSGKMR